MRTVTANGRAARHLGRKANEVALAGTGRSSPPLSRRTSPEPVRPAIVPPTVNLLVEQVIGDAGDTRVAHVAGSAGDRAGLAGRRRLGENGDLVAVTRGRAWSERRTRWRPRGPSGCRRCRSSTPVRCRPGRRSSRRADVSLSGIGGGVDAGVALSVPGAFRNCRRWPSCPRCPRCRRRPRCRRCRVAGAAAGAVASEAAPASAALAASDHPRHRRRIPTPPSATGTARTFFSAICDLLYGLEPDRPSARNRQQTRSRSLRSSGKLADPTSAVNISPIVPRASGARRLEPQARFSSPRSRRAMFWRCRSVTSAAPPSARPTSGGRAHRGRRRRG